MNSFHVHFEIETLLSYNDRRLGEIISQPSNPEEARRELAALGQSGQRYLVVGNCDNTKSDGSCAGHSREEGKGGEL